MTKDAIYNTIRQTVNALLPGAHVVLFGSRARGSHTENSDYDLLVISPQVFTRKEKLSYSSMLHKAIVKAIKAPVDLLLYSEEEITAGKKLPGHIVRFAMKEGIAL